MHKLTTVNKLGLLENTQFTFTAYVSDTKPGQMGWLYIVVKYV